METIVPGPAGPACVPGLLAFASASLGRADRTRARLRGLGGVGGGGEPGRDLGEGGGRGSFFRVWRVQFEAKALLLLPACYRDAWLLSSLTGSPESWTLCAHFTDQETEVGEGYDVACKMRPPWDVVMTDVQNLNVLNCFHPTGHHLGFAGAAIKRGTLKETLEPPEPAAQINGAERLAARLFLTHAGS